MAVNWENSWNSHHLKETDRGRADLLLTTFSRKPINASTDRSIGSPYTLLSRLASPDFVQVRIGVFLPR
jgi:hypothetical protein